MKKLQTIAFAASTCGRRGTICSVLLVALAWGVAGGETYYVDAETGLDANTGLSAEHPWRTLGRVNRHKFAPGDKILLRSGRTWTGQLKPATGGAKGRPVIIDRYGDGPKPHIRGRGVMPAALVLYNVEYIRVANLRISNHGEEPRPKRYGVMVHVNNFGTAHKIELVGLDVHDVNGSVIKKKGGGAGIIFENQGKSRPSRFDGLLISGCTVRECRRDGIKGNGPYSRDRWMPNLNVVIRKNVIEQIPGDAIVPISCDGAVVEHNVVRDFTRLLPVGEAAAGIWAWSCDNTLIQFNEVSGHKSPWDAQGFGSGFNCRNTRIQYNYSHDNEGGFAFVFTPTEIGFSSLHNEGTIVRYNVSINDGVRKRRTKTGKYFSPVFHVSGPITNTKIYNNTIIMPPRADKRMDKSFLVVGNWGGDWPAKTLWANNMFVTMGPADFELPKGENMLFTHNLYHGRIENRPPDDNAVLKSPRLKDVPRRPEDMKELHRMLMPQENSPAIGAGRIISDNGGRDFAGNDVPNDEPPTIGAFERCRQ